MGERHQHTLRDLSETLLRRRLERELDLYRALCNFEASQFSLDRLLRNFLSKAMAFFKTSAGTVFFLDPARGELQFRVVRGRAREKLRGMRMKLGEGIAGWVAKTGRPRLVCDVRKDPQWRSEIARFIRYPTKDILAVPLVGRSGKVTGVLELLNSSRHAGFSQEDLQQLVALSGPIGNLFENVRLWSETRRRNQQLRVLNQVSHLVNSTLDPREVRRRAIEAATRLLQCEAGSLLLCAKEKGDLYFEVALGKQGSRVRPMRLRADEGIAGWVVKHGRPVVIEDCRKDPRWSRRVDRRSRFVTRDMVCVPVKVRGKTIGAIQTINRRGGRFDEEDLGLLVALADQVAVALENARLFAEVQRTFLETSEAMAEAIELRDAYTGGHTRRVTEYSLAIGSELNLSADELEHLKIAAILHDIGKLGVDDLVLRKPGRLDPPEFEQMKKHPRLGAEILEPIHYLALVLPGVRSHHERNDGHGYPDRLRGRRIPLLARIIAVADTYDAMTSSRPYRQGLRKEIAVQEIIDCTPTQFHPQVTDAFLRAYRTGTITGKHEKLPKRSGHKRALRGRRGSA